MFNRANIKDIKALDFEQRLLRAQTKCKKSYPDYINETGEVICKLCGARLRVWQPVNGHQQCVETGSYSEITLDMLDGTHHETALCRKCASNLTEDQAELIYLLDVLQWQKEADEIGRSDMIEPLKKRIPVAIRPYSRRME